MLAGRNISASNSLSRYPHRGDVMFVSTGTNAEHESYLTQPWVESPLKGVLAKFADYRR